MHIAQGVFKAMNVNKCTFPGTNATFVFWVADWFALMNDKMGGQLDRIKIVGEYLIEVWKAAGMDLSNVTFKWASEEITQQADKYWPTMLDVARRFNITRVKKCCQIMGRLEGSLTAAQILYPLMQCTDVFFLNANICQLGVDQRKVNMLAREYCDAARIKHKPIILSHHMLFGLKQVRLRKSTFNYRCCKALTMSFDGHLESGPRENE
jgi:tyrosyl-tRNA synthetase